MIAERCHFSIKDKPKTLRFIDLFSGAGLLGYGFYAEGYSPVAAYEADPVAAKTHSLNLPGEVTVADLSMEPPSGECDLIVAGPPCQGFSSIGRKRKDDPRNAMCLVIPPWAIHTGAQVVVVENVPAFLESDAWKLMTETMHEYGYETTTWILNAKDFGMAQNRVRSFTVYSLVGLPEQPKPNAEKPNTIENAWDGLPTYPDVGLQHVCQIPSAQSVSRMKHIPEGGDIRDLALKAPELVPPSWYKTKGKVVDIWGRMSWNGISNTLRTGFVHPSKGRFIHPSENRPMTFREAARLQGLPDDFTFAGTPYQIARQIGNGVPTGLSRAVAVSIKKLLG